MSIIFYCNNPCIFGEKIMRKKSKITIILMTLTLVIAVSPIIPKCSERANNINLDGKNLKISKVEPREIKSLNYHPLYATQCIFSINLLNKKFFYSMGARS